MAGSECSETLILSIRGMDVQLRQKMKERFGPAEYLAAAEVPREKRIKAGIRITCRRWSRIITVCDEKDPALEAIISSVAAMGIASRCEAIDADFCLRRLSRLWALKNLLALAANSIRTYWALRRFRRDLGTFTGKRSNHKFWANPPDAPVLYINPALTRGARSGGAVAHTIGVVKGLIDIGLKVRAFSGLEQGLLPPSANAVKLSAPPLALPVEAMVFRLQYSIISRILSELKGEKLSFIYQRLVLGSIPGVFLADHYDVPLVIEYNGSEVWVSKNWGNGTAFEADFVQAENACLKAADVVVTVSEPLRADLLGRGIEPERILMQPNSVDVQIYDSDRFTSEDRKAERRKLGIGEMSRVVCFIGSFGAWHGVELLCRSFIELCRSQEELVEAHDVRLLMVGDGLLRSTCEDIVYKAGVEARVHFAGEVPQQDAPALLAAADILVSPHLPMTDGSAFFGSPTKLFEYMAMGKVIIASDLGQIGQVLNGSPSIVDLDADRISQEACSVLVPPGNQHQLTEALARTVSEYDKLTVLGKRARARVQSEHTWTQHVENIVQRLKDVKTGAG